MAEIPAFDPSKPFDPVGSSAPPFDPNKPFEPVDASVTAEGLAKQAGVGVAKGAIGMAGLPGDIGSLYSSGVEKLANLAGISPETTDKIKSVAKVGLMANPITAIPTILGSGPGAGDIKGAIEKVTGPFREAQNVPEHYAETAGEFLPAVIGGPESVAAKLATRVAIPAAVSETAGQLTKGSAAEPYARMAGALAAPLAASTAANAARRVITPIQTVASPARQAAIQTLEAEDVPLTAGLRTGSNALRYGESALGDAPFAGGQATQAQERTSEAFTRAVLRRAGENAPRATTDVVNNAFTRIGGEFDRLSANNTLRWDNAADNNLRTVQLRYNQLTPPNSRAPIVEDMVNDIRQVQRQNGGVIPGDQYQAFRSRLDRDARASLRDPQLSDALFEVRNSLDQAMERSISPADLDAWRTARRQYRNMLVIEKAATAAGSDAALGLISPSAIRNATVGQGRRAYGRGQGDFAELARAGEAILKPLPQSGTAPRALVQAIPAVVGAGLAGGLGPAAGAAAAVAAPGLTGRALMSRPVQAYLGNQLLPAQPRRALTNAQRLLLVNAASTAPRIAPPIDTPQ